MSGQAPDDYESNYMEGGASLVRDRRGIPKWMHALFAFPLLIELVAGITLLATGNGVGLVNLGIILPLAMLWVLFLYLRVSLTATTLHVQYGLFGPKIPVERIESVSVGTYDWKLYGGWGIRRGRGGGWAYSTPGGNGQCFTVEWRDDKGNLVKTCITSDKADEFAAALRERIAARGGTGVRAQVGAESAAGASEGEEVARDEQGAGARGEARR